MQLYGSPGTRHRTLTAKHHHGAAGALLREAHSAQEILKAGIRAKGVESCVPLKMHHVRVAVGDDVSRSEEHTSELQSPCNLVCRLLLEKKNYVACLCAH